MKLGLHWWILLGVVVGAVLGTVLYGAYIDEARQAVLGTEYSRAQLAERAPAVAAEVTSRLRGTVIYQAIDGIAEIFLSLLKMIVIPLVFFSLAAGIAGMGDMRRLGRIGIKTFALYILTSLLAIVTGLIIVNVIKPGVGTNLVVPVEAELKPVPESFWEVLLNMVPENVVASAANFDLIGVILFTLLFGIFLLATEEVKRAPMVGFIEAGADVMLRMTRFVIALAPVGIAALIARMVATTGPEVFISMIRYVVTVMLTLGIHLFITLPALIYLFTRHNPYRYLRAMSPALLTAFSTASSSGTLGVTMERAEKGAGVSKSVTSFVLPLGATINMDGTALYEIVSVIFIAQLHASIDPNFTLTFGSQLLIVFLGLMVSIGAAGIPHAGLVMMVIILQAVGLPVAYTALIWTVDRLLDMSRTAVNVASD
ncbi:MAG TPA: dicarboxylate/amino acid:cation symporter, partial [Thermoanaerobaculia bacterium]|nr:dicarboxylate/amino acid:cation symporter [Thermoanaerobaculia bacterium]